VSSTLSTDGNLFRFDDITVDGENFRVQKAGENITLTPRAFDVFIFLIKNGERVVEKQEIFDSVWKDTFVGDNALTKIIKEIRQAIDDDANQPRYIETVLKRGYRFIGEITENPDQTTPELEKTVREDSKSRQKTSASFAFSKTVLLSSVVALIAISALAAWLIFRQRAVETSSKIRSIAVLPFKPLNADSRDESLEMGMAETLITRLSSLKQITVRPMSAVRKYTDLHQDPVKAGQEIQAETVLEGSIQKANERIRVTVRLINVSDGMTLWSEQFDENLTDIFKVQDSIAERITNALTLRLSKQENEQLAKHYTDNPEAYQLYLRGQFIWHRRRENWIEQSLAYYQQALEKDSNFALAHIAVAEWHIAMIAHRKNSVQEAEPKARSAIVKALEIDENLAQAHNALAELKYQFEYDWATAEKEFKKAIELNPNVATIRLAYCWFLMSAGRFDEATKEMEKARQLDPSSIVINIINGRLFYYTRQYDQAIQHLQNIVAIEPNEPAAYITLSSIYEQKQMYAESVETQLKARSLKGDPPEEIEEYRKTFQSSGWQGFLRKQLKDLEERAETKPAEPLDFARIYTRLGMKDEAFFWLDKTFETRIPLMQIKIDPFFDSLRDDPRYAKLLQKINLQP
jgi:TolB-like protein/DNA-binding winged helix-turn-helix (wHTH) protein